MKIISLNTKLTSSANHFVFHIDAAPDAKINLGALDWKGLKVSIKDGLLYVVKPSEMRLDHEALLSIAARITSAERQFAKATQTEEENRDKMLRELSVTLGVPLDTDQSEDDDSQD